MQQPYVAVLLLFTTALLCGYFFRTPNNINKPTNHVSSREISVHPRMNVHQKSGYSGLGVRSSLHTIPACKRLVDEALEYKFVSGGYSDQCQPRYLTYGACLQLLRNYSSPCNGFFYSNKICHLVDRSQENFKIVSLKPSSTAAAYRYSIMVRRLTSGLDNCKDIDIEEELGSGLATYKSGQLVSSYKKCVRNKHIIDKFNLTESEFNKLPRLNILISATSNWVDKDPEEFKKVVDHWKCYTARHGYEFTLNLMDSRVVKDANDFFVARHESLQNQYLQTAQFTLHLDADSIILNMSRSLEPFLQLQRSVIFQMRENYEIAAGVYIVRNDWKSWCFLRYWRQMQPSRTPKAMGGGRMVPGPNSDNGALVGGVLQLLPESRVRGCLGAEAPRPPAAFQLVALSSPHLSTAVSTSTARDHVLYELNISDELIYDGHYPEHTCLYKLKRFVYNLGTLSHPRDAISDMGLYVLWIGEGMWRSHEKPLPSPEPYYTDRYRRCYPSSDLIGHGDKKILTHMYMPEHSARCAHHSGSGVSPGHNTQCTWLNSTRDEVSNHVTYCVFNSPSCYSSVPGTGGVEASNDGLRNLCSERMQMNSCHDTMGLLALFKRRRYINYDLY
jgi:hypothetical protein